MQSLYGTESFSTCPSGFKSLLTVLFRNDKETLHLCRVLHPELCGGRRIFFGKPFEVRGIQFDGPLVLATLEWLFEQEADDTASVPRCCSKSKKKYIS